MNDDEAMTPASQTEGDDAGPELPRAVLDSSHEAFVAIDGDGLIVEWNLEAERAFGFTRAEAIGRELAETIIPDRYRAAHREGLKRWAAVGQGSLVGRPVEFSALHRDGVEFPVKLTIAEGCPGQPGERRPAFHAFVYDMSERKVTERVLVAMESVTQAMARAESPEQAMRTLLATLGESMDWQIGAYWRLDHDSALECVAAWARPGVDADAFIGQNGKARLARASFPGRALDLGEPVWVQEFPEEAHHPRAEAARAAGLQTAIAVPVRRKADAVGALEFFTAESRVRDRSVTDALVTVGAQVGELLGLLEERQALLTSLARLALTDQLTGLPNRRAWEEGLQRELARASRDDHPVCVAVIDLDNFKRFNDERGHQAGDALLAEAARAWQAQLRVSDLLARYGGEEFAAVIPAWPLDIAVAVVERLRAATPAGLTASAGVASWNRSETAAELFGRADAALYEAKQTGRNRTIAAR